MQDIRSVNLVVGADGFQEDSLGPLMLNKPENDSEIVSRAAGPGPLELTL
jgi:hypothetical protein